MASSKSKGKGKGDNGTPEEIIPASGLDEMIPASGIKNLFETLLGSSVEKMFADWKEFAGHVRGMAEELRLSHECHERIFITLGKLMEAAAATQAAADLSIKAMKDYQARLEAELEKKKKASVGNKGDEGGY